MKYFTLIFSILFIYINAQVIVDNKGTLKNIDQSKWLQTSNDIINKNSGNVGIGISTTPTEKLEINGNVKLKGAIFTDSNLSNKILYANSSGTVSPLSLNGLSLIGGILSTNNNGTVTNVSGNAPIMVTNTTTTPQISLTRNNINAPSTSSATATNALTITGGMTNAVVGGTDILFTVNNTAALWNANQLQGRNISTTVPATGQFLSWNGSNWTPNQAFTLTTTGNSGTASYNATTGILNIPNYISSFTQGSVIFANASGAQSEDNANFFWNNTSKRFGLGINTPEANFHLKPSSMVAGNYMILGTNATTNNSIVYAIKSGGPFGLNGLLGIYEAGNSLVYGISRYLPSPSGSSTLGGYFKGLGIGGSVSGTTDPIFGVLNSAQSGNGLGSVAFTIYANNKVVTYNSTLDDASGNMNIKGNIIPTTNNSKTLGNSSLRWAALYAVNGTIQTSDIRLKKNIKEIPYGLSDVMKMKPVTYDWKDGTKNNKIGFIAQELKEIIPEVVVGDETKENLGINYAEIIPVLTKAIQEQQQQIEALKKENAALKDALEKLIRQ